MPCLLALVIVLCVLHGLRVPHYTIERANQSLPRTVLEAMAWETPVLATSVFGLPELIDDGATGWLCEPRDTFALATALSRALDAPEASRAAIARDARELVERRHSLPRYAERVAELLEAEVADRPATAVASATG